MKFRIYTPFLKIKNGLKWNTVVFLGDIFKTFSFIPVKNICPLLKTHCSKHNWIFDYARLRHAIPKAWLRYFGDSTLPTQRHDVSLKIPYICTGTKWRAKVYMI